MEMYELLGQAFDVSRVRAVLESLGVAHHLASRQAFDKHIVREFPFEYRRVVGFERLVFFTHIPKTAGSSLSDTVYQTNRWAMYRGTFSENRLTFDSQMAQFLTFDLDVTGGKPVFLCGHYNYGELVRSSVFRRASDQLLITIRDPRDVVISQYNFMRTVCTTQPDSLDAQEFSKAYGQSLADISLDSWLNHAVTRRQYLLTYHVYLDMDTSCNLSSALDRLLRVHRPLVVPFENYRDWIGASEFCMSADGEQIPTEVVNVSTKHSKVVRLADGLVPSGMIDEWQRERFIYDFLLAASDCA